MKACLSSLVFGASLLAQQQPRVRLPDETLGVDRIIKSPGVCV